MAMRRFQTGDDVKSLFSIGKLNRFVDAVNILDGGRMTDSDLVHPLGPGEIGVYFGRGANVTLSAFRAVELTDAMVGNNEAGTWNGIPAASGAVIDSGAKVAQWGVMQDSLYPADTTSGGAIITAVVHGLTPALVEVKDVNHTCVDCGGSGGALVSCENGPGIIIGQPRTSGAQYLTVMLDSGGGGGATLAAVVTMPLSGGGIGAVSPVTIGSGGEITITSGANIPAKFPYLDGYN